MQVAETREKRSVLATEIIKGVMLPQFVILPLAVLLLWLALVRGIKPLSQPEERIRARRPDDLTPLAGLRMQADLAQREGSNAEEPKQSLKQIGRFSMRATHTVNQLVALARAESSGRALPRHPCNLAQLTMEAVRDSLPRAMDKHIDLGYDGTSPEAAGVTLSGNATLLKEIILNLLDSQASSRPACWPIRSATCWCCRSKTPGRAFRRANANWCSSRFTGHWAPTSMARDWACRAFAKSPASTTPRSGSKTPGSAPASASALSWTKPR